MIKILLGGVSGVGKSTIGHFLKQKFTRTLQFWSIGDFLREEAFSLGVSIDSLPLALRKDVSKRGFRAALGEARAAGVDFFILDSHFAVPTSDGNYEYPFGEGIKDDFDLIIILIAEEGIILSRSLGDISKVRQTDIEKIKNDQLAVINRAKSLSERTNIPCYFLENLNVNATADEVMKIAESIKNTHNSIAA